MSISGFTNILTTPKHEPFNRPPNPNHRCSNGNTGLQFRVSAKTKDLELKLSNLESSTRGGSGNFSAPVKPTNPKQTKEDDDRRNYHLNMGYAIRTLREEFPALFYRELSFDIFRDDIVFKSPFNSFVGIENYKSIFRALRFNGKIFFRALWIEIVSVWQPVDGMILVRWTIHGIPRVPWESHGRFDATSEYKLDKNGKIYEHKVHNIAMNSPTKFRVLGVEELIRSLGCPSTPKPTYFESTVFRHSSEYVSDHHIQEPETYES